MIDIKSTRVINTVTRLTAEQLQAKFDTRAITKRVSTARSALRIPDVLFTNHIDANLDSELERREIEQGVPPLALWLATAAALRISPEWLLFGYPVLPNDFLVHNELRRFVVTHRRITDDQEVIGLKALASMLSMHPDDLGNDPLEDLTHGDFRVNEVNNGL